MALTLSDIPRLFLFPLDQASLFPPDQESATAKRKLIVS